MPSPAVRRERERITGIGHESTPAPEEFGGSGETRKGSNREKGKGRKRETNFLILIVRGMLPRTQFSRTYSTASDRISNPARSRGYSRNHKNGLPRSPEAGHFLSFHNPKSAFRQSASQLQAASPSPHPAEPAWRPTDKLAEIHRRFLPNPPRNGFG